MLHADWRAFARDRTTDFATSSAAGLRAIAAAVGAVMIAYVGVVHEVLGTRLYPEGPALLGGPLGWHALGVTGIAIGLLILAGVLGVLRVPVVPLAATVSVLGAVFVAWDALARGGFHFFAYTALVAGCVVMVCAPPRPHADAALVRGQAAR